MSLFNFNCIQASLNKIKQYKYEHSFFDMNISNTNTFGNDP